MPKEDTKKNGPSSARQGEPKRTAPGSQGERGREGEQYQAKETGDHPAYGKDARDPNGKDEDYGNRGLKRKAGTTKTDDVAERGIGHAEDYDARYDADSSKPKQAARDGRDVVRGQSAGERDAAKQGESATGRENPSGGFREVENDKSAESGKGDLDISPGAAGGSKNSKRDPASR